MSQVPAEVSESKGRESNKQKLSEMSVKCSLPKKENKGGQQPRHCPQKSQRNKHRHRLMNLR